MLSKKFLILFLIIVVTILQSTALNYVQILKTKPDILLILVIFFGLYYGRIYGMSVGAVCGWFGELTSASPAGLFVFTYSLAGLVLGYIGRWVYRQRALGQIYISFISSMAIYLFLFFIFQFQKPNLSFPESLMFIILPASFYTACVAPVLFRFLKVIFNIR